MTISLDGMEQDHNWMRGNEQSFHMVSQAIDMLVATKDFTFDIVTCVTRRNYAKLDDIKAFLISKGVKRWRLFTVLSRRLGKRDGFASITVARASWATTRARCATVSFPARLV